MQPLRLAFDNNNELILVLSIRQGCRDSGHVGMAWTDERTLAILLPVAHVALVIECGMRSQAEAGMSHTVM